MSDMIEIRGKKYLKPAMERMKRKQIKEFQAMANQYLDPADTDWDVLWDMIEVLVPKLPKSVLDDLEMGECQRILVDSGIISMKDDGTPETGSDDDADVSEEITMGESSASTV